MIIKFILIYLIVSFCATLFIAKFLSVCKGTSKDEDDDS